MSANFGYRLRKSVLLTYSKMREGVLLCEGGVREEVTGLKEGPTHLAVAHDIEQTNNVGTST